MWFLPPHHFWHSPPQTIIQFLLFLQCLFHTFRSASSQNIQTTLATGYFEIHRKAPHTHTSRDPSAAPSGDCVAGHLLSPACDHDVTSPVSQAISHKLRSLCRDMYISGSHASSGTSNRENKEAQATSPSRGAHTTRLGGWRVIDIAQVHWFALPGKSEGFTVWIGKAPNQERSVANQRETTIRQLPGAPPAPKNWKRFGLHL